MTDRAPSTPLVLDDGVAWPEDAVEVGRVVDAWGQLPDAIKAGILALVDAGRPSAGGGHV